MRFHKLAIIFALLLTAHCTLPTAQAQGNVTIRRGSTVPAACDVTGVTSAPIFWKISGVNPGFYTCVAGVYVFQTNTFGSGLTAKTMIYVSAAPAAITSTAAPTNGQILIGSTGLIPALGTLTGTANETLITNGAGSITIGLAAAVIHQAGTNFRLTDTSDTAKRFHFDASNVTTANDRNVAVPDSDTKIPISAQFLTFAGPTAARTYTLPDVATTLVSGIGTTSKLPKYTTGATGIVGDSLYADDGTSQTIGDVSTQIVVNTSAQTINLKAAYDGVSLSQGTLVEVKLSTTASVDMNTAAATTLYTCPSATSCLITKVVVRNASTSLTTASYSFGWTSAAFDDVIANATHTELTGATLYTRLDPKAGAKLGAATEIFKVLMNTLQGGAATTTIEVLGYTF